MTSIAFDGKVLASDSRMTVDSIISSDNIQKLFPLDNIPYFNDELLYCGLSGDICDWQKYLHLLNQPKFYEIDLKCDVRGIVVGIKHAYYIERNTLFLVKCNRNEKMAEGSGRDFALSCMSLGSDAADAIKHAKKFDSATGGRIQSVKLF